MASSQNIYITLNADDIQEFAARWLFKRPMITLKDDDSYITWDSVAMEAGL